MLPEVALVEVKVSATVVLEPAVTVEGVAVNVAVGAGVEVLPLPELEDEPPQLAKIKLRAASNAKKQILRRTSRAAQHFSVTAEVTRIPQTSRFTALRGIPHQLSEITLPVQGWCSHAIKA
jgi:hypothetical protein